MLSAAEIAGMSAEPKTFDSWSWVNGGDYIGVKIDGGTPIRVSKDDVSAVCQIKGKWHSDQWGWNSLEVKVPVEEGVYKISYGDAYNQGGDVTLNDGTTSTVIFNTYVEGKLWSSSNQGYVVCGYYTADASKTLTLTGGNYQPYFAIEKLNTSKVNIVYSLGGVTCEGILPSDGVYETTPGYTIPSNFTLYKEGYTLTGWTDGVNTYSAGDVITAGGFYPLTPVFTPNAITLNDRAAATVITWGFRRDNGAPIVEWQGSGHADHIWVTQVTIGGKTIDVKMDLDASSGKFNNASNTDCTQTGSGTTFVIPSLKDAVIELECHGSFNISTTTIDGSTSYTGIGTSHVSYTVTSTSGSSTIVIGDGSYYKYVKITLPAQPTRTVTIGSAKYATYYSNIAYTLPENLQAATVDENSGGTLTLNYRYKKDDVVPGGTAVLLKATAAGDYTLTMQPADATAAPAGNLLHGSDVETTTTGGDKYYALQNGDNGLGFYWKAASGAAFTSGAHKAWLALPDTPANFFSLDDETTGVKAIENSQLTVGTYYDLQGRKVAQPTKGLYIVNGKKVIIK